MATMTSREVVHNFAAVSARVAAGEEITVTRYGKPILKLMPMTKRAIAAFERDVLVHKAQADRAS
jgi:antitoxin (DNA-binding transcriptional repressor) of toxin-antitoxin stability system